jgi:2-polyprenyl-6-methoxyphenol hydroxylase-like FAD-dependent oxidoreductase
MRVVVIGGGPVGLAVAHGLISAGAEVVVLEGGPRSRHQGSGLSLFGNGIAALDALGLGAALSRLTAGVSPTFCGIRNPRGDWLTRTPDAALTTMRVVHREALYAMLVNELPSGTVRFNAPAELLSATDGLVRLDGGEQVQADLVVLADGIRSRSRKHVTSDPGSRPAGYGAWRGVTRTPMLDVIPSETWGTGRRFGLVPLADGRVYWFAVSSDDQVTYGDPRPQLLERFADWHEPIAEVVRATEPKVVNWLPIEELARPLRSFTRGRAVLVGDAAHAMTPNLGQGANQGFEDAATLYALLRESPDIDRALARYDALRRPWTRSLARKSRLLGVVGQLSNPVLVRMRDAVMRATPDSVAGGQFRQFESLVGLTP